MDCVYELPKSLSNGEKNVFTDYILCGFVWGLKQFLDVFFQKETSS